MQTNNQNATNITIGPVRLSYARLFEPESMNEGDPAKYSTSVIIPKSAKNVIAKINSAIDAAKVVGKDTKFGGKLSGLKTPLRDGDTDREDDKAYANAVFFNCSSRQRPGVVDINRQPILNEEEVYSGCFGYINVSFYPFNSNGNKGIAVGLNHFMKTKDGEPLGGGLSAEAAFSDIEIEDDDFDVNALMG